MESADRPGVKTSWRTRDIVRCFAQIVTVQGLLAATGVLAAGTWRWPRLWILVAATVGMLAVFGTVALKANPEVVAARGRVPRGTKRFDKVLLPLYGLASYSIYVVAGVESMRLGRPPLPGWSLAAGLILLLATAVPLTWVMAINPWLERTVRLQRERGHKVVTMGPYRVVRHPMYVTLIVENLAICLVLGSRWALASAFLAAVVLVVRTALEDRTLHRELEGYAAYATRTRYRLLPGVW